MFEPPQGIWQISLGQSRQAGKFAAAAEADENTKEADLIAMRRSLLSICPVWPHDHYQRACPYPVVVPQSQLVKIEEIHRLLSSAITNIVERWWFDEEAHFPQRMPLETHEEEVLRWMESLGPDAVSPFRSCRGSWRPDFLLEKVAASEEYRICEINARFAFNGFLHTAYGQRAYMDMNEEMDRVLNPAAVPKEILDALLTLFNPAIPLHLLKGEEAGADIDLFILYVQSVTGLTPILIRPSALRLLPDASSPTGNRLYCAIREEANGNEILDRVYQIGLELHQHELRFLSPALLREISLCCFNDLRTIFLVHDKRMLGIVLQELNSLVNVHKILTPAEAGILRRGITPTTLPGSQELTCLMEVSEHSPDTKDTLLLKPIRSGKGAGIVFGSDLTPEEWLSYLSGMREPEISSGRITYVVQRRVEQSRYDMLLHETDGLQHNYLVGTYMSIHGRYLGLGFWRTSPHRICALSRGGTWICTVSPKEVKSRRFEFTISSALSMLAKKFGMTNWFGGE